MIRNDCNWKTFRELFKHLDYVFYLQQRDNFANTCHVEIFSCRFRLIECLGNYFVSNFKRKSKFEVSKKYFLLIMSLLS